MKKARSGNPASIYLEGLSAGSRWGMKHALETIAEYLSDGELVAAEFPWWQMEYSDSAAVRRELIRRYAPSTVNRILSGLRGVLKTTWRLGLMNAETYQRAVDVANVKASKLLSGRVLKADEIKELLGVCREDRSPAGRRDAAMFGVLFGAGLRRGELAGLDLEDFDATSCSLSVRHGKHRKQRTVYLLKSGCRLLKAWIRERGPEPGPLFCPILQNGESRLRRLRGESIAYILRRLQERAGIDPFTAHDLRRSYVTQLLDNGVDLFTVQQLAGHSDATTTARYDRRGEAAKRRAAQTLRLP